MLSLIHICSVVMMFGLTKLGDEVALRPFEIFQKEVVLKASFINPYTQQRAVDLINAGRKMCIRDRDNSSARSATF